ncbi:MAG: hypothetical protein HeimC3_14040 [Candidatus Heimdallarchaeota archaeon LC_3]|nr:MAG: hypothetical protein HeimC3_14040 [Candidatus Heimdallarchaeota archaeon LC_3]
MKRRALMITVLLLITAIPGLSMDGDLSGTYEKIDADLFEINVYLPTSHYNIRVVETNYTIENSMITNVVNFTVNQNELQILIQSFTITGDSEIEYYVYLNQKKSDIILDIVNIEFLISFILGGFFLLILYKTLTRRFKEKNKL